jgi:predicted ATP-grasp superfamily ATP-dependent carboligase
MKFNLDINKVASDMLQASASSLIKGGEQASEYASHEYAQFIEDIEHVQTMAEQGTISAAEAQALVDQHKMSMQAVLLCVEGLGVIAVQNAINAALQVLNTAIAAALGTAVKGLKFHL